MDLDYALKRRRLQPQRRPFTTAYTIRFGLEGFLTQVLFAMTWLIENQVTAVIGVLAYGVAAFAVVAPLQLRVMAKAGDAPDVASAANISAFTLGSALGDLAGRRRHRRRARRHLCQLGRWHHRRRRPAAGPVVASLDRRDANPVDLATAKSLAHHH